MKVTCNGTIIKIATAALPKTYEELIRILPLTFASKTSSPKFPSTFSLTYLDSEIYPVTVMNQMTCDSMLEDFEKNKEKFILSVHPETTIIKVEDLANQLPVIRSDLIHPIVHEAFVSIFNENPQNNRVSSQVKYDSVGNDQRAHGSSIPNPNFAHTTLNRTILAQDNENFQGNREPAQAKLEDGRNDQRIHPIPIYTFENVEFVVNEPDALRKGLSDRIEESQKRNEKNSKKRNKLNKGSKLRRELRFLEKDNKTHEASWKEWEDRIEKKIKISPIASIGVTQDQSRLFNESLIGFQERWQNNYSFETDFERGFLKVKAVQEWITGSRSRPNPTITDENLKDMINELLEALKIEDFTSLKIHNLSFNFENCQSLSQISLQYLFQTINNDFKNVRILNLNFSVNPCPLNLNPITCEMALELHHLEVLSLNFRNRCEISQRTTIMMVESVGKNSKNSLKSLHFSLPASFYVQPKSIKKIVSKLDFVQDLVVFPRLSSKRLVESCQQATDHDFMKQENLT